VVLVALAGTIVAVPGTISFQGLLTDSASQPISGLHDLQFSIYDQDTGGTALWTETQSVSVTAGHFSVELGSAIPIPDSALAGDEAWLEIMVDTDSPITPRTRLTAVPYARVSSSVRGTGPLHLSDIDVSSGDSASVRITVLADSGVTETKTAQSSSGYASGKRQHKPLTIRKEWGATHGTATVELSSILHADSGFSDSRLYTSPVGTVEAHENGHALGHGHLDYLKKVGDPATGATAQIEVTLEPDSGVIETTTTEHATGQATGRRKHGPITISASSMTTASSDSAYWERTVAADSGYTDSTSVSAGGQSTTTVMKVRPLQKQVKDAASSSSDTASHESLLSADSGYAETAGMTKSDLITEIGHGTSQTREHILLSRQVGVPAVATSASLELENTNDGPRITMSREGTSSDPNDDGVVILDGSVPSGVTMTMFLNGDTATTTTAKSDKRKQSLYFPASLYSALDLLVDGTAAMIILKKLDVTGGVDSNVVIDNNGDMQLAGEFSVGGNQGTVANATTFTVPRISTSQRDALTAVNGMIIYNTTTNQFNFHENGAWVTK
jgi:hypothetical protein